MTAQLFDNEIRRYLHARPFENFVILMDDGRSIHVDQPKAAMSSGGAGLIDADGAIQFIECDQVREFRLAREEFAK